MLQLKKFTAIAATCLLACPAVAQETPDTMTETVVTASAPIIQSMPTMLTASGALSGTIITADEKIQGETKQVANAKVTLVSQGKVLDIVTADNAGTFSFTNVQPGEYQVVGSADGLVGSQVFKAASFTTPAIGSPSTVILQPTTSQAMYDSFANAPVATFAQSSGCSSCSSCAPAPTACNTCSAGGGGFGGGSLGSRLGGRLGGGFGRGILGRPALGLIGLAGLAGLDDDDDASPDQ